MAEIPLPGVRWCAAAWTAAHGFAAVTGASEPKASATPAAAMVANGFIAAARSGPSRRLYRPSGPPQAASNIGCMLATVPVAASVAMASSSIISACSIRCAQPASRTVAFSPSRPSPRAARRATELTASSPMAWKPACTPASVQATRWSAICCSVRYLAPRLSGASR